MIEQFLLQLNESRVVALVENGWDNLIVNGPVRTAGGRVIDFHRYFHSEALPLGQRLPSKMCRFH
jgi:hypothetical protein